MARGKRTRLTTGIYEDHSGRSVVVKVNGVQYERRYALGTPLSELKGYRTDLRDEHKGTPTFPQRGTLRADVAAYLSTLPKDSTHRRNADTDLHHWLATELGEQSRHVLTPAQIKAQLSRWSEAGVAASTINHRRQALLSLYQTLDGKRAANPVREVPRVREPNPQPRGFPLALVSEILDALPDRGRANKGQSRPVVSQTKARLWVMALTGLPQKQLMRLTKRDVHWTEGTVYIAARLKGKGARGRTLPLTRAAVTAFRHFDDCNAWGPFSTHSMAYSFARAVRTVQQSYARDKRPWPAPPNVRPYDLRHAFLTEVYRQTRDIRATAELGLHADLRTTSRYTEAAVTDTAKIARDHIAKSWAKVGPGASRCHPPGKKGPKPSANAVARRLPTGTRKGPSRGPKR